MALKKNLSASEKGFCDYGINQRPPFPLGIHHEQ
jgi:hypothetical protein